MSARIGQIVHGRYRVLSQIGKGGMSVVYLVEDILVGQQLAMKEILHEMSDTAKNAGKAGRNEGKSADNFEAELLSGLEYPAFPRLYDAFSEGGFFLVREYIEGEALDRVLRRGPFSAERAAGFGLELGEALQYLHGREPPVIYRDMKPSNIILRPSGNLSVVDFGISGILREGEETCLPAGTRGYAAPEQYLSGRGDIRSDVYSLGMTLFELITGIPPAEDPWTYRFHPIRRICPSCPPGLEQVINRCIRYSPEDRYQDCGQLLSDLRSIPAKAWEQEHPPGLSGMKKRAALLSACIFLCAGALQSAERLAEEAEYERCLEEAGKRNAEDREALFRKAFSLKAGDPELYVLFLSFCEEKGCMEEEELQVFLDYWAGDERFLCEEKQYPALCMQAGKTVFFLYSGREGSFRSRVKEAEPFFGKAEESGEDEAYAYCRVCAFYRNFDADSSGEQKADPAFLQDMLKEADACLESCRDARGSRARELRNVFAGELADLLNIYRKDFADMGIEMESVKALYREAGTLTDSAEMKARLDGYTDHLERIYENTEKMKNAEKKGETGNE